MISGVSKNDYKVSSSGLSQEQVQATIAKSKQVANDSFENNTAVQTISSGVSNRDNKGDTLRLIPVLYLVNKQIDKMMGGEESKSILTKMAHLGDKISHVLHLDKVVSNGTFDKISKKVKSNRFTKYFTSDYAAIPKSALARHESMAKSYETKLAGAAEKTIGTLEKNILENKELYSSIDAVKGSLTDSTKAILDEIAPKIDEKYLKKVIHSISEIAGKVTEETDKQALGELETLIKEHLSGASATAQDISIPKLFGQIKSVLSKYNTSEFSKDLTKETVDLISPFGKKYSNKQMIDFFDDLAKNGIKGVRDGKFFEMRNKFKAANSELGKTMIGNGFAKGTLKTKDVLTYGGDLLSLYFAASAIVSATKEAKEAPKGEKLSTFMHVLSESYIGIVLLQPSTSLLYKLGGNKYRGLSVESRNAVKELVKTSNANHALTKEGLKVAKLQKKLLMDGFKPEEVKKLGSLGIKEAKEQAKNLGKSKLNLKFWERPLKWTGKVLDTALDDIKRSVKVKLPVLGEKFVKLPSLKGFLAGAGRLAIIVLLLQPLLSKPVTKLVHKIFGKPKTYLAKKEAESKKNENNSAPTNNQPTEQKTQVPSTSFADTNLIKQLTKDVMETPATKTEEGLKDPSIIQEQPSVVQEQSQQAPKQDDEEALAALNLFKKKDKEEKPARYIPSIEVDFSGVDELDADAQKQIKMILKQSDKDLKTYQQGLV